MSTAAQHVRKVYAKEKMCNLRNTSGSGQNQYDQSTANSICICIELLTRENGELRDELDKLKVMVKTLMKKMVVMDASMGTLGQESLSRNAEVRSIVKNLSGRVVLLEGQAVVFPDRISDQVRSVSSVAPLQIFQGSAVNHEQPRFDTLHRMQVPQLQVAPIPQLPVKKFNY
eukprot:GHVS01051457.1.p1 GENE.GHVS01051457.1~~GHVS01051457.1.p1  ORF type:complete len:172 (+),score=7.38 GHVS01051457.1:182-697(+)